MKSTTELYLETWKQLDNTLTQFQKVLGSQELPEADNAILTIFCNQWQRQKAAALAELEAFEADVWEICVKHPHIVEHLGVKRSD